MKITLKVLEQWNACERYRKVFAREYPNGVEGTAAEIASIPDFEHDQLWILLEMAVRVDGVDGDEALHLLVDRADASRLARAVERVSRRDATPALERLIATGDLEQLTRVVQKAPEDRARQAAAAIDATAKPHEREYIQGTLSEDRRTLLQRDG